MRQSWWKVLTILLLVYVIGMTFIVRLDPGLLAVDQTNLNVGTNECIVVGHNTHFDEASTSLQILLKSDTTNRTVCGEVLEVLSPEKARVAIEIPQALPSANLNLFVNNDIDGTLLLANAFYCEGIQIDEKVNIGNCASAINTSNFEAFGYPFQPNIIESIRNLTLHVPMWFTMFFIMLVSFISSIRYLSKPSLEMDMRAVNSVRVGLLFAVLGLVTGSVWARFTWGAWWVSDPQLNGALITFLIYVGYLILRAGIEDDQKRARVSAVFNIFAYVILFILLMILPRFSEGLHPGKGGNPGFNKYDLDSSLRAVFYPAVIGWILLGYWIYNLRLRMDRLEKKLYYDE